MKITFVAKPNSQKHRALTALCEDCRLKETSRTVIGTNEENLVLAITFEGPDDHYKLFNNRHYVAFSVGKGLLEGFTFYSLDCMDGFTGFIDGFKKHLESTKKEKITILNLDL